jgi:hypothetical protein
VVVLLFIVMTTKCHFLIWKKKKINLLLRKGKMKSHQNTEEYPLYHRNYSSQNNE